MQDLNDMMFFARVVEAGGFMAASRVLGVPKSRLSRRVALLEEQLGVRLLQRTTRRLALTDIGSQYYQRCQAMLAEAEAAADAIASATAEPRGLIRVSCPELLAKTLLANALPQFMQHYPQVRLQMEISNRRVELIEEGIDVALRVRTQIEDSAHLVARRLGISRQVLVTSPALLAQYGTPERPEHLALLPAIGPSRPDGRVLFTLQPAQGKPINIAVDQPRLTADDLVLLAQAASQGVGIAQLPQLVCHQELADGRLLALFPDWQLAPGIVHAVFPTRRGMLPALRAFIDFLSESLITADNPCYDRL